MSATAPSDKQPLFQSKFLHKRLRMRQPTEQQERAVGKKLKLLQWQVNTLARALEFQSNLAESHSFEDGVRIVVNWLKAELECEDVSIATWNRGKLVVQAIANHPSFNRQSKVHENHLCVHRECSLREAAGTFPAEEHKPDEDQFLISHQQLARHEKVDTVRSEPLVDTSGEKFGSVVMLGERKHLVGQNAQGLLAAIGPTLVPQLQLLQHRRKRNHATSDKRRWLLRWSTFLICIFAIAVCWIPIDYRINCRCVAEPFTRRFAFARFDGIVAEGFAEHGDIVEQGAILARLDGRKTRWQLSSLRAKKKQSEQQRQLELAAGNISDTFLAELESEKLRADEEILEYQLENLEITSPIAGVVLQGSLDRAEAAAVEVGQVLFEIGPLSPIQLEASIPSDQINLVAQGDQVEAWIEGLGEKTFEATIRRIRPRAEIRNGRNVFVADIEIPNEDLQIRPGMKGRVRILGPKRTVGWIIFRQPWEYLRTWSW